MSPSLNLIWLLCGGISTAIEYLIVSSSMMVTIIDIPFDFQTLRLAGLALWPFGREVRGTLDSGSCFSIIMNIVWLSLGGIWTSLSHLRREILSCIAIIGISSRRQHFKFAGLTLTPLGKTIIGKGL